MAGGTSMLSTKAAIPAPEGEQEKNLEREEAEQGMCRCDCKNEESSAAIGTVRDGVGMDTLQEQMGKTSNNTSSAPSFSLCLNYCSLNGAENQAENCHVFFTESRWAFFEIQQAAIFHP